MAIVINEQNKARINALYRVMKKQSVTKEQVMGMFNVGERVARELISEVAKRVPVYSASNSRGYRVLCKANPQDYQDALHAYNENKKRAEEILKRNDALAELLGRKKLVILEA